MNWQFEVLDDLKKLFSYWIQSYYRLLQVNTSDQLKRNQVSVKSFVRVLTCECQLKEKVLVQFPPHSSKLLNPPFSPHGKSINVFSSCTIVQLSIMREQNPFLFNPLRQVKLIKWKPKDRKLTKVYFSTNLKKSK